MNDHTRLLEIVDELKEILGRQMESGILEIEVIKHPSNVRPVTSGRISMREDIYFGADGKREK